ncbi:hypothetical protein ACULNC_21700 [Shigella flexneri]
MNKLISMQVASMPAEIRSIFAEWRSLFRNRTMWGMMLDSVASTTLRGCTGLASCYLQTAYNLI